MAINLRNPLVFIDLETTGVDIVNDRIVEIAVLKLSPNGEKDMKCRRVNPTIPIPPETTAIHGITDADVANEPTFKEVAKSLAQLIEGCDLAGFNSNKFDFPLLAEEFLRAGVDFDMKKRKFIDVQTIFHKMEKRTLEAAYKFYCQKELTDAHTAEADTWATMEVLESQIEKYPELENDVNFLSEFSSHNQSADFASRIVFDEKGQEVFNFGKYKGQTVESIFLKEPSYYSWMMNGDFPLYTKKVITNIYMRVKQS